MFDYVTSGRWWDVGIQLIEGCTKVSPGCDNCCSLTAANMRRFNPNPKMRARYDGTVTKVSCPQNIRAGVLSRLQWTGQVNPQWQDLDKIGRSRTPKVYTFWNDLFHPGVPEQFIEGVLHRIQKNFPHFYIICTKRTDRARDMFIRVLNEFRMLPYLLVAEDNGARVQKFILTGQRTPGRICTG